MPGTLYAGVSTLFDEQYDSKGNGGIFKSTDAGRSWSSLSPQLADGLGFTIAIDPHDANVMYTIEEFICVKCTYQALLKSTDGGQTWTKMDLSEPSDFIMIDPAAPSTVIVGGHEWEDCLGGSATITTDGGDHWRYVPVDPCQRLSVYDAAGDAADPSILLLATSNGLMRSTNGGTTWDHVGRGISPNRLFDDGLSGGAVYASGSQHALLRSVDGGLTWASYGQGLRGTSVNSMAFTPAVNLLYAGTGNGVFVRRP